MPRHTPAAGHALRRLTLGSGPLKRTSDRLEALARILLGFVLLLAIAVALAVATATYTQRRSEATAQAADRQRVMAELLEDASAPAPASGDVAYMRQASVVWTAPSGDEHQEVITVFPGARAGSTLFIWVDRSGDRTSPPMGGADVAAPAVGQALLTYLGISVVAVGAYRSFRSLLERSRARRWGTEWEAVEPVWTGRGG
jgi:membrane protein implicated in regulation of membrane protease activity